ncbi:MAG TPA: serine/threonine-protein kinase, partial [Rudaea sp.]
MTIDAERFRRIEALFHAASALPTVQRAPFLEAECGDDAALRSQLGDLLDGIELKDAGPATELLARASADAVRAPAQRQSGRTIGPWRLVRPLGAGGMGSVFLAERVDGAYRTQVALKMLNPWLRGSAFEQRFARERQILSDLQHPSIAALLDGGVTDDGVPYLVMEFVRGEPITDFAKRHTLDIAQRLRLLLPVCRAVQHAHQNLIVHRDLKPGNILVTDEGMPKLLDFGIAKLLALDEKAQETAAQTRLLTPEYASPEQLQGRVVTTASDVYSLGVVLHELLVGERPIARADGAEITRPSSRALHAASDPGAARLRERRRRSHRLRGDLDTLLLRALAADPDRRYATAAELGDDIERYLRNEPLRARPDTLGYRARKFVRRHRLGVALGSLAVVLIVGAAIVLAVLALRLREERDRSGTERVRAEQQAHIAQRVSGFLEHLFDGANPNQTQGAAPTLRDVLDRGARDVDAQLEDDPVVQARLLVLMADAYRQLGDYGKGIRLAEHAVALRRTRAAADAMELAESIDSLGELRRSNADYADAERLHREALSLRREAVPADPVMIGRSLNNLALTLSQSGHVNDAIPLYEESLALRRAALGDDAAPVLATLVNIGLLRRSLGDYSGAEAAFREVYERRLRLLGEHHVATANAMTHLGHALLSRGAYEQGEDLLRRALQTRRELLGPRSHDVSMGLVELARARRFRGNLAEAESLLRDANAINLELFGADHAETEPAMTALAEVLLEKGDQQGAEKLLKESVRICSANLGPDHPRTAAAQSRLGEALLARGAIADAEPVLRAALAVQRRTLRGDDGQTAYTVFELARIERVRGHRDAADSLLEEASTILAAAPRDYDA